MPNKIIEKKIENIVRAILIASEHGNLDKFKVKNALQEVYEAGYKEALKPTGICSFCLQIRDTRSDAKGMHLCLSCARLQEELPTNK